MGDLVAALAALPRLEGQDPQRRVDGVRETLNSVRLVIYLIGRSNRWRWISLVVMALVVMIVEIVGASAIFLLLALISGVGTEDLTLPVLGPLDGLIPIVNASRVQMQVALAIVGFFVLRAVLLVSRAYLEGRIISSVTVDVGQRMLAGYVAMPYAFHTQHSSSDLVRNTFDSTQQLEAGGLRPTVVLISELALVSGLAALLVVADPVAALLAALVLGSVLALIQRVLRPRIRIWGMLAHEARSGTYTAIQQSLGGIRDLKVLAASQAFLDDHLRYRRRIARSVYLNSTANALPRALIELGLVLTIVAVFLLAVLSGDGAQASLSTLGLFAYAGIRLQPALQMIVGATNQLRFVLPTVEGLIADEERFQRWSATLATRTTPAEAASFTESISLEAITFTYAGGAANAPRRPALGGVDLEIRRGEFVGICGPTGGGKSTLLDLIVGLLQPTSGQVLVDGRPLDDEPAWWWSQIGVVSQQVFLIDDTLRRNIAFGVADGDLDEERLRRCIERAQLERSITELPSGLDTIVGERGVRLSGGQRQRVAIARALYRDPKVLILDEGTSALDTSTEAAVIAALDLARKERTIIAVAHRLDTIRTADRIIVVDGGRIVGDGPWGELARENASFQALLSSAPS